MANITLFLLQAVIISFSGVMAPGAMTAATIAQGTHRPFAGTLISIGHAIVEIPLIFLLILGLGYVFELPAVKIAIGLLGGAFLIWMGANMLRQIKSPQAVQPAKFQTSPIITGIMLSATNPWFLLWWATVGLNLALGAKQLGIIALILFAIVHWICDFIWLTFLSFGSFHAGKHSGHFTRHFQKTILLFCSLALIFFGLKFIYSALIF